MNLEFLRPATSSVSAEYRLGGAEIAALHDALEQGGRAEYSADLSLLDEEGVTVANASATITILQRR